MSTSSSYVCDTLPAPRLATSPCLESSATTDPVYVENMPEESPKSPSPQPSQPPPRKLCVRHQRMADEGTNLKLQQSLDALPVQERESVSAIWSNFSSSSHPRRALILQGLLTMCCFSQLSLLAEQLAHLIRIDPFTVLPGEVSLKILSYLDATSLCRAAQVSRQWKRLADDDILWRGICEQHIGQKCLKCGWGLPILEKRRKLRVPSSSPCPSPLSSNKRELEEGGYGRSSKRQRSDPFIPNRLSPSLGFPAPTASTSAFPDGFNIHPDSLLPPDAPPLDTITRPWKDVYSERLTIERNWRRGRCDVRTLEGHNDGVMCLQFSESFSHPSFPVLITGSYDRTARVWNLETGQQILVLRGHTRAVRALQFDEAKLITGSMDHTIRVWNWRTGRCLRTLEGHTEGVVCLNFDSNVLASGSVDATIKVWNFRSGEAFTLRGHLDWINAVQLWDSSPRPDEPSSNTPMFDSVPVTTAPMSSSAPHIDPGKMLFSASDDGTIRLWDLTRRTCVRQFASHMGQVQSMKLLLMDESCDENASDPRDSSNIALPATFGLLSQLSNAIEPQNKDNERASDCRTPKKRVKPVLISGSLDNTIKVWDINTGKVLRTLFGHIEGVWAVASDKLRLVSGSHDRTIKVWARDEGRCTSTLVGHRGAVTCLALGEDKIVSGSDDGDVKVWCFSG